MPPAVHMEINPRPEPFCSSSLASVAMMRAPVADVDRFNPEMGTTFLESIGQLASAALHRLNPASPKA